MGEQAGFSRRGDPPPADFWVQGWCRARLVRMTDRARGDVFRTCLRGVLRRVWPIAKWLVIALVSPAEGQITCASAGKSYRWAGSALTSPREGRSLTGGREAATVSEPGP